MQPTPRAWSKDLCASFVVLLISLPLCVGIAAASGVHPAAGLISGIIGGLVVASLGGCPLQVTGPTATLAVVVFELVEHQGLASRQLLADWESRQAARLATR